MTQSDDTEINVLYLYEKSLANRSTTLEAQMLAQVNEFNAIIYQQYGNFKIISKSYKDDTDMAFEEVPSTVSCVSGETKCTTKSLSQSLYEIRANKEIKQLRANQMIDLVVLIREFSPPDEVGDVGGTAFLRTPGTDSTDSGFAVIKLVWNGDEKHYTVHHEIGHLLTAGHSEHNPYSAGVSPRAAHITHACNNQSSNYCWGFNTLMAYTSVARTYEDEHPIQYVTDFYRIPRFSSNQGNLFYEPNFWAYVGLGDDQHNNIKSMSDNAYSVSLYSRAVAPNRSPVPKITFRDEQPRYLGTQYHMNSNGSRDPDGDKITFDWKIMKGDKLMYSRTSSKYINYTFQELGEYKIILTGRDHYVGDPKSGTDSVVVNIKLEKPSLVVIEQETYFILSNSQIPTATHYVLQPFTASGDYLLPYDVPTTWNRLQKSDLPDNVTQYYRVAGCGALGCSEFSNLVSFTDISVIVPPPELPKPCRVGTICTIEQ